MMGHQNDYQHKLFINGFNLDKRIRKDHILRKISENIDFDFIYKEVEDTYKDCEYERVIPLGLKIINSGILTQTEKRH